jgi:CrcB protein
MNRLLLVALGGALGSLARFGLSSFVQRSTASALPWGTLSVNTLGCLIAGAVIAWLEGRATPGVDARLFIVVGLLGGFTTFSAFGVETLLLLREGRAGAALFNVAANLLLGIGAAVLGWSATRAAL